MTTTRRLSLVTSNVADPVPRPTGLGIAARAFVDAAMQAFTDAITGARGADSPINRARAHLGEDAFLVIVRNSIERHAERVLGDPQLVEAAATVPARAVDAAILDVVAEVLQDVGRAAWERGVRS